MDDAKEFRHAVDVALSEIKHLAHKAGSGESLLYEKLRERVETMDGARSFIFSLSEEPDLLSQWRAYCKYGGFSIGFDHNRLLQLASVRGYRLLPCVYDSDHQQKLIREVLQQTVTAFRLRDTDDEAFIKNHLNRVFYGKFLRLATTIKHPSFAEEREWRLVGGPFPYDHDCAGWQPGGGMLIPYHEFVLSRCSQDLPLEKIYVGPSAHRDKSCDSLSWYLRHQGLLSMRDGKGVEVRVSETPYRTQWR